MHQMPVRGHAVVRRILTHRRDAHAVAQPNRSDRQRLKQMRLSVCVHCFSSDCIEINLISHDNRIRRVALPRDGVVCAISTAPQTTSETSHLVVQCSPSRERRSAYQNSPVFQRGTLAGRHAFLLGCQHQTRPFMARHRTRQDVHQSELNAGTWSSEAMNMWKLCQK